MDEAIRSTLRADQTMADLVDRWGPIQLEPADREFRRLVVSIVNQQLSTASARAVKERTFAVLDDEVTPERVLAADPTDLADAGLSRAKIEYLDNAARAFREQDFSRAGLADLDDAAVIDRLTDVRGIGEWTARMYLMFVLGREDVLPLGDLAIRRGIQSLYGNGESLSRAEMRSIGERWRPYRSYGSRYVWLEYEAD